MAEINLKAKKREITNKGANNRLRVKGFVPSVLYSKIREPLHFSVPEINLRPLVYTTEMNIVNLLVDENENIKCVIKNIQFDPVTDKMIHADFQALTAGQEMQVQVPVLLIGQAPGIKEGGLLQQQLHKFDIECLPKDLPEHLEVDISNLKAGDSIFIGDLSFENIKFLHNEDTLVVSVSAPRAEEESAETGLPAEEEIEPEVIGKKKESEESEG